MIVRAGLLLCVALSAADCIATDTARHDGCDLPAHQAHLFDDRLDWARVSRDASRCYLEGFSEDERVVETQVRYLQTWAEDHCGVSLAPPPAAGTGEDAGQTGETGTPAFSIAIMTDATATDCVMDGPNMREPVVWGPSVDIASRNLHRADYPPQAAESGLTGTTMLVVWARETGAFGGVIVSRSSGHPSLDAAAVDAAQHWTYNPGEAADGRPFPGHVGIPVDFTSPK